MNSNRKRRTEALQDSPETTMPSQKRRTEEQQVYENGVLRALVVENFMNHKHLRVDFDPHVNFIVGKNGSGKSAIVNALIAGFGHRATSTGRNTNSSKSLIMHGKEYASIQMHIANGGDDAFKPDEFGDTIVAEHRLERNGSGTYRLKDGAGVKGRKSSKAEFMELCSHLNIQANNPCALLTQEHAKKFLHHGSENDRYKFFLQAANLEERKRDLNVTHENILLLRQRLGRAQEGMEDKREYAEKCAQEYDGAKKLKELTDKLDAFEPLLGWAMVTERENELKRVEAQAAQAAQAEAEAKKEAEAAHEDQREQEDRVAELERRYAKTGNDIQSHAVKGQRAKEQATGAQKQVKRAKKQMAEVTESLRMAELEAAAADDDYNNHLSMMESTKDSKQVKQMRRVHQLHQKIGTDEQAEAELQQVVEEKRQTYSDAIETSRKAEGEAKEAQREEKAKEAAHKEAQRAGFDKLAQLHPDMSQLLDLLKKHAKDFASPPLGPIGAHIAVQPKHATLGAAVELAIHPNNLCSFIVFSKADEMKLHDLLKKVKPKQNVMPLRDLARVAWRSVEPRFTLKQSGQRAANAPVRLIDAVDVTAPGADGDAFYNFLLDSCSAEHKLVFDNVQEAQRVVWSSRERFAEAIACPGYSQPARKVLKRNETTGSEPLHGNRNMLARDKKAAVESSRAEAATAKEEASRCARRFKEADTLRKQVFEEEKAARKQLSDVTNRLTATREEYDRLIGESVDDAVALEVDAARQTAQRAREDIERFRRELEAARTSHEDAENAFQPLRERLGSFGDKYDELMSQSKALEAELDEARAPLTKSKTRQSALRKTLAAARAAQEESEKKAADLTNNLAMLMPQVQSIYGDRVHDQHKPARSVAVLQEEKRQLEAKIKREEQKHGGKQLTRLAEEAAKAKKMHDEAKSDLDNVVSMEVKEAAMLKERHKFFKKECKGKGYQAANDFNNRLSRKGHAGSLTFDHDHETLSLTVSRNSQDENSASTADARNLSGGERSFTTLSFEIAMCAFDKLEPNPREALTKSLQAGRLTRWEFCATPFRVLDEFDVYMDHTYIKQAVDTLMELCDTQTQRQFLFLTPQDMYPFLRQREAAGKSMPKITRMSDVR